jgi:hypothetical protein
MQARGMPNNAIQFYFSTPQRPVNNGRVSEIKSGYRGADIQPASQFSVDEFIQNHPLTIASRHADEPLLPEQVSSASVFTILDTEEVDVVPDPPFSATKYDGDQVELYNELGHKADILIGLGSNALAEVDGYARRFREVLPKDIIDSSIVKIWTRGNSLRATLRAHDATRLRTH